MINRGRYKALITRTVRLQQVETLCESTKWSFKKKQKTLWAWILYKWFLHLAPPSGTLESAALRKQNPPGNISTGASVCRNRDVPLCLRFIWTKSERDTIMELLQGPR